HSGELYVGYSGWGTLTIQNGGQVSNTDGFLGSWGGSSGTATVDGIGSTWTNTGSLYIGGSDFAAGGEGWVTVLNGGCLVVDGLLKSWGGSSLDLGGGRVTAGSFDSSAGTFKHMDGTLTVQGGDFKTGWTDLTLNGTIGTNPTLVLDGATVLDSYGTVTVGDTAQGTLRIKGGTQFSQTGHAFIGNAGGSAGAVTVDGIGSTWTLPGQLYVGFEGGGTLAVQNGGQVSNTDCFLGSWGESSGAATVDGSGSTWALSGQLCVGYEGAGTLTIRNGGQISSTVSVIGYYGGPGGAATVDGIGSTWTLSGQLCVGYESGGTLTIQNGGQVSNTDCFLGSWGESSGTAIVDGIGSTWTHSGGLCVGYEGTAMLSVQNGGQVSNLDGFIGWGSGSGGAATVDGSGSTWTHSGALYVGGTNTAAGGAASLTVQNDGLVSVGGTLKLWKADSAVTVNAGTLIAGALAGSAGILRITDPAGGAALTVGSAASDTFSGVLRDDTGPGSLTKVGAGTQTLAGTGIMYTGTTTVLGGKLKLSNTTAFASGIFNSAATEFEVTAGTWTFDEALGGAGAFTKSGAGTLVVAGPQDYGPGAAFDVLGGALSLNTDASGTGLMADAHLALSVTGAELRFGATQHLDTLAVGDGGKVLFAGADRGVVRHLANTGAIDLAVAALVVDYEGPSPLADVAAWVRSGLNAGAGYWDGLGIASSAAAGDPDHLTALGVLDNTDAKVGGKTTFAGEAVDETCVLVKYTWWGDANLDGV
ncbi:MAG: hypothetical protein IMZ55_15295, partial [Acidobacteria bacterium]|nr:hypothetical protein [Acidobacteriota bacterium]